MGNLHRDLRMRNRSLGFNGVMWREEALLLFLCSGPQFYGDNKSLMLSSFCLHGHSINMKR